MAIQNTESDVSDDGLAEEISVLRNVADGTAQGFERPILNGMTVNQHGSFGRFPEPGDEGGECGFTASGGPDYGKSGAGRNLQVDVGKNRVQAAAVGFPKAIGAVRARKSSWVTKSKIPELNFADRSRVFGEDRGAIVNIWFRGKDEIQAAHGSGAALEDISHPA